MTVAQLPDLEMPAPLSRAVKVRADRAADLAAARERLHAARVAVETAVVEDRAAYAAARDQGGDDSGPERERGARAEVAECERREAGEALREARAEDDLAAALGEHVDAWTERVAAVWKKQDAEVRRALTKLQQAEERRSELRTVALWLGGVQQTGSLDERIRPASSETAVRDAGSANAHLTVHQLLDGVREHIDATAAEVYTEGAPARAAARERDQRLAELRVHERLEVRVAVTEFDGGSFTAEEVERVAAGATLAEVREQAERRRQSERPASIVA
jgi:hypothetical protein